MLTVRVINNSRNPLPQFQTIQSAGLDLMAHLTETVLIRPLERKLIGTGLHIELPAGYEAQIRSRSGLALKYGISVLNSPGTIDADYRGEIKVILINLGEEEFEVKNGDRIAQMIIAKYEQIEWMLSTELNETNRGTGGYGHTGINTKE